MRLTQRLLLGATLVVGFLAVFIITVVDGQLRDRLSADARESLTSEARLVGAMWVREILTADALTRREAAFTDALANRAGTALRRRVTLIAPDGTVLGDSEFDGPELGALQNHAGRPEVAAALAGGAGEARRVSPSTGDVELYVAVPVPTLGVARVSLPVEDLEAVIGDARRDVLSGSALALIGALLIALIFARSVTNPVVELRDVAQAIANGDLARRPTLHAPGEVGELAAALRALADQLSARLHAHEVSEMLLVQLIESLNEGVIAVDTSGMVVRINETGRQLLRVHELLPFPVDRLPREVALRDALTGALAGATTEGAEVMIQGRTLNVTARPLRGGGAVLALFDLTRVRRLEAVRRDFVANVSHELRTPLTVIGGFAETLTTEDVPAATQRQFAERILGNTRRMQRIVDDLLDLSRIESGGWLPNPEPIDLHALAAEVLAAVRDTATAKGLTLEADIAADAASVRADATALRQVLGNLVENAVRHTASGRVRLSAVRHVDELVIAVRDTGSGIPAKHLPRIFERFYRVDPGRSRAEGGTGLGLSIVRHLVEAHGGHVRAESVEGVGTEITVRLPADRG
ncbi:MAG TPA: ATP-binding protein [Gemmatimonadaceae bacterium]|nr:ATP-binding protein [Gemmatimonadaceae bacterium]